MNPGRVEKFRRLAGSEFQTDRAMKLNEHERTDLRPSIFKNFSLRIRRCVMLERFRAKPNGKMGVCTVESTCKQKLQSYIHRGISQAANEVHVTVIFCGSAFVSSER